MNDGCLADVWNRKIPKGSGKTETIDASRMPHSNKPNRNFTTYLFQRCRTLLSNYAHFNTCTVKALEPPISQELEDSLQEMIRRKEGVCEHLENEYSCARETVERIADEKGQYLKRVERGIRKMEDRE